MQTPKVGRVEVARMVVAVYLEQVVATALRQMVVVAQVVAVVVAVVALFWLLGKEKI
jgi:hypothetical protein